MRKERLETTEFESGKPALIHWNEFFNPLKITFNIVLLTLAKFLPLRLKNKVLRALGTEVGENSVIALGVMFDIFCPEKIKIGENSTIGYGTTILTHETTQNEFRAGEVIIGDNVLIGANSTVLPGVEIEDGAKISAGSLVNKDVGEDEFVGGVPAEKLRK